MFATNTLVNSKKVRLTFPIYFCCGRSCLTTQWKMSKIQPPPARRGTMSSGATKLAAAGDRVPLLG